METFKDAVGRTWTIAVSVNTVKRVRATLDINLMEAATGDLLSQLATDPVLLCDVLYVVCQEEADAKKVTDEDFGRAMAGDVIDNATKAFLEELANFFPPSQRTLLRGALGKYRKLEEKGLTLIQEYLDGDQVEREFEDQLRKVLKTG